MAEKNEICIAGKDRKTCGDNSEEYVGYYNVFSHNVFERLLSQGPSKSLLSGKEFTHYHTF